MQSYNPDIPRSRFVNRQEAALLLSLADLAADFQCPGAFLFFTTTKTKISTTHSH